MDLNELLVFARVVQAGSFTEASRRLGMPKSTVSRKVSELEERLGARLLQRTTRKLSLTDVGQTYFQYAERIVADVEAAELAVTTLQEAPRGPLRMTVPLSFDFLAPIVAAFLERYAEVELEIVATDRVVDLVDEGFDLGLRAGELADSTLVARNLGKLQSYVVASPRFLRRHGSPDAPADLARFDCLVFGAGAERARWKLMRAGKLTTVNVGGRLTVNDFDLLEQAALAGLGIAKLPVHRCIEALRAKKLRRVLADWCSPEVPIHAVYASTRHLSPKLKAMLEHLREHMSPPPWQRGPVP